MDENSKSVQCNLNATKVRSFGTITCNIKPATRDKCSTCDIRPNVKHVGEQTFKNTCVKACQTLTFGSSNCKSSVACQTGGFDGDIGHLYKVLYILHTDRRLDKLYYQMLCVQEEPCLHVFGVNGINFDIYPGFPAQLFFFKDGRCIKSTLFKPTETSNVFNNLDDTISLLCDLAEQDSRKLCNGIDTKDVVSAKPMSSTSIFYSHWPSECYRAKSCETFVTRKGKKLPERCFTCTRVTAYSKVAVKRKLDETPTRKLKRARPGSKAPFSYLTPRTRKRRVRAASQMRWHFKQKVLKLSKELEKKDLLLCEEQYRDMKNVSRIVNDDFADVVDTVIKSSTEKETERQTLRQIWQRDCSQQQSKDKADFQLDQRMNTPGNAGNRWSPISYRIALAVYSRSPAAFEALSSFNIIKLPSVHSVRKESLKYKQKPGICHEYLQMQQAAYDEFKQEKRARGEKEPLGIGVLIFDEVKIIDKLLWNSKSHSFVGLAMDENEYVWLKDIFALPTAAEPRGAEYVLQFLWRDLTSKYDVIGPYFFSPKSVDSTFVTACLFETIRACHAYMFKVLCLVCDGAATNLTVVKHTLGITGSFTTTNDFVPNMSFSNPFDSTMNCHWIICPAHQLKNMVSALHSSRPGGTKDFVHHNVHFGWLDIQSLKAREDDRCRNGQLRFVPGLLQSYVDRDSWTRLNVKPSKIMQQDHVLQELYDHANSNVAGSLSAKETHSYLTACNLLFERGFMAKKPVYDERSPIIENIDTGYQYFETWLREIKADNPQFSLTASQSPFLAWQTYDLLRVCVFGIRGLIRDFQLCHSGGYFLVLSRITGSAVESVFSQMKYASNGKLSSVNFASASSAVVIKSNITSKHRMNSDYRDVQLNVSVGV